MSSRNLPNKALRITLPTDREVVVSRSFRATRHAVFAALTQPSLLRRWMFAPGRVLSLCEVDLRPGGAYHFVYSGSGKRNVGVHGVYREIEPAERIVNTETWDDWDAGETLVTTTLVEGGGQTTLTVKSLFPSKAVRDEVVAAGLSENAELVYAALAEHLHEKSPAGAFA